MIELVRVLLVGDHHVGKSTIITSLIKEAFVANRVTDENTYLQTARPENKDQLEAEIRKADVICIVYAVNDEDSFNRVPEFWLPYIRKLGRNVPVVLVGNKIDLRGSDITNESLEAQITPIMNEFKEVETCVECSAKQPLNVSEVFYFAQKAVLHPTAPLYDSREHTLKPACIDALRRIFRLCDLDKNGALDDEEINEFQAKCFGSPLQRQELESVKLVVKEADPNGVTELGLTEIGFLYLHTLFIQRGRLETTWTVLRQFGYGNDLSLREDYLWPPLSTFIILVPLECSVELSSDGYQFFTDLFQTFDQDKDGALKSVELDTLFSTSPGIPWLSSGFPETTITNESNSVTLQGFLAQWSMTTLLDYKTTLAYLAYLGYNGDTTTALKITKPRKTDRKRGKIQRAVFSCYVFGATGSGKTSLLKAFINRQFNEIYVGTEKPYNVVNSIEIGGAEKYLVESLFVPYQMQEFGANYETEILQNKKKLESCDVICFVYDSGDVNSFAHVANLRSRFNLGTIPCVFIATKSDQDLVPQKHDIQPDAYCRQEGLIVPVSVSVKDNVMADVFHRIVEVAMEPYVFCLPFF
ncbi:ERMES complex Ca(2+)-binding regulatory GTPase gem1 [Physocladia obscura]|uniref:Mitochondrial Rho GTPase n=1 Tax=Physocladia obscura TaxID=109957 RepID=A0AAD5T324_9FUNG|nr:ERMES complex Ca(2+)-binding regulatory GTPase gem1 [Physocladia obscura]